MLTFTKLLLVSDSYHTLLMIDTHAYRVVDNVELCSNIGGAIDSIRTSWWCHQMETFSVLLAFCAGNLPVISEFPTQRPVMQSFGVFFDLRLNQQLSNQYWWFEMPSHSLWCHYNGWTHNIYPRITQYMANPQKATVPSCLVSEECIWNMSWWLYFSG